MQNLPPPPPSPVTPHLVYEWSGASPADRFGAEVALGDVDGDGHADVLVGAPGTAGGSGRAVLFSGRHGGVLLEFPGEDAGDRLGTSVSVGGDVDGDGIADLALGAPAGTPPTGAVEVRSGADGSVLHLWTGSDVGERFGQAVAFVGDADADGFPDVLIGAPQADGAGFNAGRVALRSGRDGSLLQGMDGAPWDLLGTAVAAVGDGDGDGSADGLVGAPFSDAAAFNGGAAHVLSGASGATLRTFPGAVVGDQLGTWVAGAGDVDGDGGLDVLLGVPGSDAGGLDAGACEVRRIVDGTGVLVVTGGASGEYSGTVAGAGDTDGDGRADFLFGSPSASAQGSGAGLVRLVDGDGVELASFAGPSPQAWFGVGLAGGADVNGDGRNDLVVGAPVHDDVVSTPGTVQVLSSAPLLLAADVHAVPLATGGAQNLTLTAPAQRAGSTWILLGTAAGTSPPLAVGPLQLPLAPDPLYFPLTLAAPQTGQLDGTGTATTAIQVPAGLPAAWSGLLLHHAYLGIDAAGAPVLASNAVPLTLQ